MIAIALPDIVRGLGTDLVSASWLVTLYLIAMAALQPVGGKLGDTFGRRRLLLGSLAWFAAASVGCALSNELGWLIGFRLQQALAGAVLMPNAGAIVRTAVGGGRGSAFALVAAATGVGAAAGPVLGGVLVAAFDWRATFAVNVPLVAVALALGWAAIPPDARPRRARFDVAGAVGLSVLLAGAAWTLSRLRSESAAVLATLTGALVICAIALVRYERAREDPIVQPRLFRDRTFAAANGTIALSNCAMYATMLAVPVVIARSAGTPGSAALSSGAALAVLFVTSVVLSPAGGRLADRAGRRWPSVAGHTLYAAGALLIAAAPAALVPGLLISGVGLGLLAGGLRAAAVETVEPERAGVASGIFSTSRYEGGIVGALLVSLLLDDGRDPAALFIACAVAASLAAALSLLLEDWPAPEPVAA